MAVLLTLALVSGGYALALALEVSGPLAVVAAGLALGNANRRRKISERMRNQLDSFWELIDGVLNATLFLLIGLQVLVLKFHVAYLIAALLVVPTVLLARFISVGANGGMIEFHPDPETALSDGRQSLDLEQFAALAAEIAPVPA